MIGELGGVQMGNEGEIELSVTIYDVTSLPLTVGTDSGRAEGDATGNVGHATDDNGPSRGYVSSL